LTFIEYFLITFGSLLPIINPLSTSALVLSLTEGWPADERRRQVGLACIYAFGLLIAFLLVGDWIVDFFGITIDGIRVAGGLIVMRIGFGMMTTQPDASVDEDDAAPVVRVRDIAFSPLAMPSLSGPGSISFVLAIATDVPEGSEWRAFCAMTVGIIVVLAISFFVLSAAARIVPRIGPAVLNGVTRIMGFILISIGAQLLLAALGSYFGFD
jgi:multiple antibiotic resistance protein